MGEFGGGNLHQITPSRSNHVWFDLNDKFVTEPHFSYGRNAKALFTGSAEQAHPLELSGGWGLRAYEEDGSVTVERTESTSLLPSNGLLMLASGWEERYAYHSPTEKPNATTGASANLATQGYKVLRKSIVAGTNWDAAKLTADQTAFPGPTKGDAGFEVDATIQMDRIAMSLQNDNEERPIYFLFTQYGHDHTIYDESCRLYFNGPAGFDSDGAGTGQYCLSMRVTGKAVLYEKKSGETGWIRRLEMSNAVYPSNIGQQFSIVIKKSKSCNYDAGGTNGWISFSFGSGISSGIKRDGTIESNTLINSLIAVAGTAIATGGVRVPFVYRVPGPQVNGTVLSPLRVDFRRDLMGSFTLRWLKYGTSEIVVQDSPFELPFTPSGDEDYPFTFSWDACKPTGCNIYCKLFRADTGAELAIYGGTDPNPDNNIVQYVVPAGVRRYYVKAFFTSNGTLSPVLNGWEITRQAVLTNPGEPSWEIGDANHKKSFVTGISITGAERDLSHESCTVSIVDPLKTVAELRTRAAMPIRIETEYNVADRSKRCRLFRGIAERIENTRKNSGSQVYPQVYFDNFEVFGKGIWALLEENFIGGPIMHLSEPDTFQPRKVTDLIKEIISNCGFDPVSEFDFPDDIEIRIISSHLDYSQRIDMLEKSSDVVRSLARDYLSHFLIFDPNRGTNGMWVLKPAPVSPYTNVCKFVTGNPTNIGSGKRLIMYVPSYSDETYVYDPGGPGQQTRSIIGTGIRAGTMKTWVKKPECNEITVTAIGAWQSNAPVIYMATDRNEISYNFGTQITADPTHPDYLGRRVPMYVIDPALGASTSQEELKAAVNYLTRRIGDLTFHAIKMMSFEAPLILIDHEDEVGKKRPLRYYDPVLVNSTQFLVRNVNPTIDKDGIQMAMYELEAPRI